MQVLRTRQFGRWLDRLTDRVAFRLIAKRLDLLALGHFGDAKSVGLGVSELRVHHGPGDRIYFTRRGQTIVVLLWGGDKSSQSADIAKAQQLAREINSGD